MALTFGSKGPFFLSGRPWRGRGGERRCLREREEIGGKTCTRATLGSTQSFSSTRCITRTRTTPPPSAGTVTWYAALSN